MCSGPSTYLAVSYKEEVDWEAQSEEKATVSLEATGASQADGRTQMSFYKGA